jgi:hypothetical protein
MNAPRFYFAVLGVLMACACPAIAITQIVLPPAILPLDPPKSARVYPYFDLRDQLRTTEYYFELAPGQYGVTTLRLEAVNGTLAERSEGYGYEAQRITVVSIVDGELDPTHVVEYFAPVVGQPQQPYTISALPYTYLNKTAGIHLRLRPLPPKAGATRPVPIRFRVRFEGNIITNYISNPANIKRTPIDTIMEFVIPVSNAPALLTSATFSSLNPGELRADGKAIVNYRVTASGSPIKNLSFRARIPKGTDLVPGIISPPDGVVTASDVTWRVTGPVTQFNASMDLRVRTRPGVKIATTTFSAVGSVLDYTRTAQGRLNMPIKNFDKGVIEYATSTGIGGAVGVGATYTYNCREWDPEGGDIFTFLNDVSLTAVPFSAPQGTFTVPPFRDRDLQQFLSARQKGPLVDTLVVGEKKAQVEMVQGTARVTDGTTVYRQLRTGDWLATGEISGVPSVPPPGSDRFDLLQISGPTSAALVRFTGDERLLYARGGSVAISGFIVASSISVHTGKKLVTIPLRSTGFPFSAYDTIGKTGVTKLSVSVTTSTSESPFSLDGFVRSGTHFHTGPVDLRGAVYYVDGDLTIDGDITGEGAILCTGNFTHKGSIRTLATIAVGGSFSTIP